MADRRGGNQSRLCLGACRCLGENEADRQASQKSKTLEQSKKRPHAIIIRGTHDDRTHSGQVLQNARRGRQHRRARKRGTSPSARVHRGRAAQTRHRRLGDVMDTPQNGVQRRRDGMRRPAIAAIRPGGSFHRGTSWPSDHPRRPPCHTPGDRIARESHCCCEPPAPKPGDVYAEGRTCLPRSRMGAVPLMSGAGRYSSCHHRRSRQSMTLSITHRIVPSCPRPKG